MFTIALQKKRVPVMWRLVPGFQSLLLHEIRCLGLAIQIESAARMLDIDIRKQVRYEIIFLMQIHIFKAGRLKHELIEANEMTHHSNNLMLLDKLVSLDHIL